MPIYEYACVNEHRTEVLAAVSTPAPEGCAVCGAPLRRVLSAPSLRFRGAGFHNTDYASSRRAAGVSRARPPR